MDINELENAQYIRKLLSGVSIDDKFKMDFDIDEIINNAEKDTRLNTGDEDISFSNQKLIDQKELDRILEEAENLVKYNAQLIRNKPDLSMEDIFPEFKNKRKEEEKRSEIDVEYPLDYIKYYEVNNYMKKELDDYLKKKLEYTELDHLKYEFINVTQKQVLYKRFEKNDNKEEITAICAASQNIITGDSKGQLKTYSIEKEIQYKTFICDEIRSATVNKKVTCIDCSPKREYIAAGYANGFIVVFFIKNERIKKIVYPRQSQLNNVITLRFLKVEPKAIHILASDLKGSFSLIQIFDGFFGSSVTVTNLLTSEFIYVLNEPMAFNDDELENYKEFIDFNFDNSIAVVGNSESLDIFLFDLSLKGNDVGQSVRSISNPAATNDVPNACFGMGFTSIIANNNMNTEEDLNNLKNEFASLMKPQPLLIIAWGNAVLLYMVPFNNNSLEPPIYIGSYINDISIIRIGFLTTSIVAFFDSKNEVKCLDTRIIKLDAADVRNNPLKGQIFSLDIKHQVFNVGPENIGIRLFNNFLVYLPKQFFVLTEDSFYHIKLLSWNECFDYLQKLGEWHTLLSLGVHILNGKFTGLSDIPEEEHLKVPRISYVLLKMLENYIQSNLEQNNQDYGFLDLAIEFCIHINCVDNLFNDTIKMFEDKKITNVLIHKFEPYILSDRLCDIVLEYKTVSYFLNVYVNEKNFYMLSQILIHFNIDSLTDPSIIKQCVLYGLINPLIYICMNTPGGDLYLPAATIYEAFTKSKYSNKDQFRITSETGSYYREAMRNYGKKEILENTKEFNGHKLLWYINLVLKGVKYPSMKDRIEYNKETNYSLIKIFMWMISYEVARSLIEFDSYSYFRVLYKFFKEKTTLNVVSCISLTNFEEIRQDLNLSYIIVGQSEISAIEDGNIVKIITMLENIVCDKKYTNDYIKQDFYEFVIKISTKIELSSVFIIESLKYILNYYERLIKNRKIQIEDKFNCHLLMKNFDNEYLNEMSDSINEVITYMYSFRKDIKETFLNDLLKVCQIGPFFRVKIQILSLQKNYTECINTYLMQKDKKDPTIFTFIKSHLEELRENEDEYFETLRNYVLKNLSKLADFSIKKMTELIDKYFSEETEEVIEQLDNCPVVQFNYIENLLDKYELALIDTEISKTVNTLHIESLISKIIYKYIQLMISLNRKELVLPFIKNKLTYVPLENVLDLCLRNSLFDASIFLYITLGTPKKALELNINAIKKTYISLRDIILSDDENERNMEVGTLEDLNYTIISSIKICQDSFDEANMEGNEELWIILLAELYYCYNDVKSYSNSANIAEAKRKAEKFFSQNIEYLLNKMCGFISIQKLVEIMSKDLQEEECKEFKLFMVKSLTSLSRFIRILHGTKKLISDIVMKEHDEYDINWIRGKNFETKHKNCDFCYKKLEDNCFAHYFKCGHILHDSCVFEIKGFCFCSLCKKIENLENAKYHENIALMENIKSRPVREVEDNTDNFQKIRIKKLYNKLNSINTSLDQQEDYIFGA